VYEMPPWDSFVMNKSGKPEKKEKVSALMCSKEGLYWLPAEFLVAEDRSKCHINSYINSLHPVVHSDYRPQLEKLLC